MIAQDVEGQRARAVADEGSARDGRGDRADGVVGNAEQDDVVAAGGWQRFPSCQRTHDARPGGREGRRDRSTEAARADDDEPFGPGAE